MKKSVLSIVLLYCFISIVRGQDFDAGKLHIRKRATFQDGLKIPFQKQIILGDENNVFNRLAISAHIGSGYINYGNILYFSGRQSVHPSIAFATTANETTKNYISSIFFCYALYRYLL
ncbi:MAG: hypothetical protein LIO93_03195 [Bacteroidales bacterium]|nr:hypothetical protein [Bacteroidales bacterium]